MKTAKIKLRGKEIEVEFKDYGHDKEHNTHDIDWHLVDADFLLSDEDEDAIYAQLLEQCQGQESEL